MDSLILKDQNGSDITYKEIDSVKIRNTSGGYAVYSQNGGGDLISNLSFSSTTAPTDTSKLWVKTDKAIKQVRINSNLPYSYYASQDEVDLPWKDNLTGQMVVLGANKKIYIIGGDSNNKSVADIYIYDISKKTCTKSSASLPEGRSLGSIYFDAKTNKIYIFGGRTTDNTPTADIISVSTDDTPVVKKLPVSLPTAVAYAGITCIDRTVYIVGGQPESGLSKKVMSFNLDTQEVATLSSDLYQERNGFSTFNNGKNLIFLIGGQLEGLYYDDPQIDTYDVTKKDNATGLVAAWIPPSSIYIAGRTENSNNGSCTFLDFGEDPTSSSAYLYIGQLDIFEESGSDPLGKINYAPITNLPGNFNPAYIMGPMVIVPITTEVSTCDFLYVDSQTSKLCLLYTEKVEDLKNPTDGPVLTLIPGRDGNNTTLINQTSSTNNQIIPYDAFISDYIDGEKEATTNRVKIATYSNGSWVELN